MRIFLRIKFPVMDKVLTEKITYQIAYEAIVVTFFYP